VKNDDSLSILLEGQSAHPPPFHRLSSSRKQRKIVSSGKSSKMHGGSRRVKLEGRGTFLAAPWFGCRRPRGSEGADP
jgi:hypothetical protein